LFLCFGFDIPKYSIFVVQHADSGGTFGKVVNKNKVAMCKSDLLWGIFCTVIEKMSKLFVFSY
jgi:hypothetical protein